MSRFGWATTALCIAATSVSGQRVRAEASDVEKEKCREVVLATALGVHANKDIVGLPRVEIRRCSPVGSLQLIAWKYGSDKPILTKNVSRFSLGQVAVNQNVFALTAEGPYDTVIVLQYVGGEPRIVLEDSTHKEIRFNVETGYIVVTLRDPTRGKEMIKRFAVEESELFPR